jgi:hypothetical protein
MVKKSLTPASRLKAQFDSYDDMVERITENIVSSAGFTLVYVGNAAKELYNELHPIARSSYKHARGQVIEGHILPHKMVVDCVYLACNAGGVRISSRRVQHLMLEIFKVGIRPEPWKWTTPHLDRICEILKCCPDDLPLRGAVGGVVESGDSSGDSTS